MNLEKSFKYVIKNGNLIEKARLEAIIWGKEPNTEVLEQITQFQRADGGFSYWVKEVSNITDTCYILEWLDDLKVYRNPIVNSACQFLLDRQLSDGGWDEFEAVVDFKPPIWMIPGKIETRVWLTGYCAHVLIRFGYAEAEGTSCPTNFLMSYCDNSGRLKGYLRATWLALPMFAFYPGKNSEIFNKAVKVIIDNFSDDWKGAYLAWLLNCLKDAGLGVHHSLVSQVIFELKRKQNMDGSWDPEEGESENQKINATISALRALKKYNLI